MELFLATRDGLVIAQDDGASLDITDRRLVGHHVTTVIAREGVILAGTRDGIYRSGDGGHSWRGASDGLTVRHVRWLAHHPQISDRELAGTEPAAIFISQDGASTWRECAEVAELRREHGWRLPYSPEPGCIRGFAFYGQRAYAAAEDGAVLRSDDGGQTWDLAPGSAGHPDHGPPSGRVHSDVHSVTTHSGSPDRVLAPTGGGLYRSDDGGQTWERLYRCYCRAAWWDPTDPQHIIFGPADGVDRSGRVEESRDGGRTWHAAGDGLDAPWPRHMVERLHHIGDRLWAVLSNGDLFVASLDDLAWRPALPEAGWIHDLAAMR
ncbi:MAG: hypothetical protein R3248_06935 [Candidatus Promineifilaceae bacterium]|nr:hypothetical protein [Candidatus Promineifilaceae bacterium]